MRNEKNLKNVVLNSDLNIIVHCNKERAQENHHGYVARKNKTTKAKLC